MENAKPTIIQSSEIKFTAEEATEITNIRAGYDQATVAFGKLYLQQRELKNVENNLEREFDLLVKQEKVFLDKIVAKYGVGTYNPSTGVFTPQKRQ